MQKKEIGRAVVGGGENNGCSSQHEVRPWRKDLSSLRQAIAGTPLNKKKVSAKNQNWKRVDSRAAGHCGSRCG
jgi:hypothetical protein